MCSEQKNIETSKLFVLDNFLMNPDEAFHLARTTISTQDDLHYHCHDYAEVFWIKQGVGIQIINGHEIHLRPGSLYMIRPSDAHSFKLKKPAQNLVITNIAFRKENLDVFRDRYFPGSKSYFWSNNEIPFSCLLSASQLNEISALIDRLFRKPRDFLHLDSIMLHIFKVITSFKYECPRIPHWLAYALENYNSPERFKRGAKEFVTLAERSADHVNRMLKKHLKQTLTETINIAKLEFASQQLILTNCPIKKICGDCGFDNLSYFHRLFKKQFKVTPLEYRGKNQKII